MHDVNNIQIFDKYLECALDIGAEMLYCGAEIHRVEDTIKRLCNKFGAKEADIFSTTTLIIATVRFDEASSLTQSRRVIGHEYNLNSVSRYNDLSRSICETEFSINQIRERIDYIKSLPHRSNLEIALSYSLISFAFSLFFGGAFVDAILSAFVGASIRITEVFLKRIKVNRFVLICLCGFSISLLARLLVATGIGTSKMNINLGNIMVLISGLLFTNSIRDMLMNNILSGMIRFFEALLIAIAISLGFGLENIIFGG